VNELRSDLFLIIAVVVRIISNPVSNVLQKKLTLRDQHPLFVNFLSYFILSICCLFLLADSNLQSLSAVFWGYSILSGITGAFGNAFIIKALEKGELSVLGPINAYKSVVGLIFAFLLIGELPNAWGFIGIILIISGSYFVLKPENEKFSWAVLKTPAVKFRFAALVLTGIQAVFDKKIIQSSNLEMAFVSWCVFGAIFSFVICRIYPIKIRHQISLITLPILGRYLALCSSVALMVASTNYSFKYIPVAEALALFQISILVSVLLGYKIFQEQGLLKKLAGSVIMIIGSLCILLI
jgi:drug/metabolite transporter (DMT)-like permease